MLNAVSAVVILANSNTSVTTPDCNVDILGKTERECS